MIAKFVNGMSTCWPSSMHTKQANSQAWMKVSIKWIKPFNVSLMATQDSGPADRHYKVEEVLEEQTMEWTTAKHSSVTDQFFLAPDSKS